MSNHEWIDRGLCEQLSILCSRGEGQYLEFMEEYPKNGHELSKEIAAFSSTNAGTILIGISDEGNVVGLPEASTSQGRDKLCQRIEGLCTGAVRPAITPTVKFAIEDGKVVLAIEIPRGLQPIYYSQHTPYLRHLTQSRPAEPHEVVERIEEWLQSRPRATELEEDSGKSDFLTELAATLITIIAADDELAKRAVNPWLEQLRTQQFAAAQELRRLAVSNYAIESGLEAKLLEIAELADKAATYHLTMGGNAWREMAMLSSDAAEKAASLKTETVDLLPLSDSSIREIRNLFDRSLRELDMLNSRAVELARSGRMEELQAEASAIGSTLLRVSYFKLDFFGTGFSETLRGIAHDLHLVETMRLYMDGGKSIQKVLDKIAECTTRLHDVLQN